MCSGAVVGEQSGKKREPNVGDGGCVSEWSEKRENSSKGKIAFVRSGDTVSFCKPVRWGEGVLIASLSTPGAGVRAIFTGKPVDKMTGNRNAVTGARTDGNADRTRRRQT